MSFLLRSLISSSRRTPLIISLFIIICISFIIIVAVGSNATPVNDLPELTVEKTSLPLNGQLTYKRSSINESSIILENANLTIIKDNLTLEHVWMNLPVSSAKLNNATLKMDSNFSLQNCIISIPDLKVSFRDTIRIYLDYDKFAEIKKLNNTSLNLTGIELQINRIKMPLRPGHFEIPELWLTIPKNLQIKNIDLSLIDRTNKSNTAIVNGTLNLSEAYTINIRNSTLVLPPGSLIDEETTFQRLNASVSKFNIGNTAPAYSIGYNLLRLILLIVGSIIIIAFLLKFLVYLIYRPVSLVLKSVEKTGYEDIDKNLEGFSQLTREKLGIKLEQIQKIVEKHGKEQKLTKYKVREFCPLPNNMRKKDVSDFLSSVKDIKMDSSPLQSIVNLLAPISNFVFPPRGIEVSCFLQRKGKNPEILGITFRVTDISEKQEARSFTFWEKQTDLKSKNVAPLDRKKLDSLIKYLEDAGEFQSAMKYQNELLDVCEGQAQIDKIREELKRIDEMIRNLKVGYRAFLLGNKFRMERKTYKTANEAIEYYLKALECVRSIQEDVKDGLICSWKRIIENDGRNTKEDLIVEDYKIISKMYWKAGLQRVAIEMLSEAEKIYPKKAVSISMELKKLKDYKASQLNKAARYLFELGRFKEARDVIKLALEHSSDYQDALMLLKDNESNIVEETLQERYIKMLGQATFYLAAEIHRFWMLDQLWHPYPKFFRTISNLILRHNDSHYKASIYNFLGTMYASTGFSDPMWFDLARVDLETACKLWEKWYLPHENLGFLYSIKGQGSDGMSMESKKRLEEKAIVEYQKALIKIKPPVPYILDKLYSIPDEICDKLLNNMKSDKKIIENRIKIGMAISYYHINNIEKSKSIAWAIDNGLDFYHHTFSEEDINQLDNIITQEVPGQIKEFLEYSRKHILGPDDFVDNIDKYVFRFTCKIVEDAYRNIIANNAKSIPVTSGNCTLVEEIPDLLERYKSPRLMYNLACYYSLANKSYVKPEIAKRRSRLFLAISLAKDKDKKDENLWKFVDTDPDLNEVRNGLPNLKYHISYEMAKLNDKLPEDKNEIIALFYTIFDASKWIEKQELSEAIT
jgi:tetratricopeptide (TPR) repeat protein